jgi:hypothetical protein
VTAIDLVGVIRSRSVMTRRNQSTGKTVGATHQHPRRNVRLPLQGEGSFMRASDWRRLLGRRPCRHHIAASGPTLACRDAEIQ